jgi:hypothetical protein
VTRGTMYNHLEKAGLSSARPAFSDLTDPELDEIVAGLSLQHPNYGANMMRGALEGRGIKLPLACVSDSLQRVDPLGMLFQ